MNTPAESDDSAGALASARGTFDDNFIAEMMRNASQHAASHPADPVQAPAPQQRAPMPSRPLAPPATERDSDMHTVRIPV